MWCVRRELCRSHKRKKDDKSRSRGGQGRTIPSQHRAVGGFVGCCRLPPRRKLKVPLCLMEVDSGRIGSGEANRSSVDAVAGAKNAAQVR